MHVLNYVKVYKTTLKVLDNCLFRLDQNSDKNWEEDGPTGPLATMETLLPVKSMSNEDSANHCHA